MKLKFGVVSMTQKQKVEISKKLIMTCGTFANIEDTWFEVSGTVSQLRKALDIVGNLGE